MAYDLRDPAFLADPETMLAAMRRDGPVVRTKIPLLGETWLTTDDATARKVLKSPDLFVRDPATLGEKPLDARFWWFPPFMKPLLGNMLGKDGEAHARLRSLVNMAFARASIDDIRPEIAAMARQRLAALPAAASLDIIGCYARPLPLEAICVVMGIPEADRKRVAHWISPISGPTSGLTMLRALPGLWRTMRHFRNDFIILRNNPRPGLINDLVQVHDAGDRLSDDELLAMVFMLFVAGHETTVHLIGNALHALLRRPDDLAALQRNPADTAIFIEEIMRFISPVMVTKPHFVARDTQFEGAALAKGDQVMALLIAANHDPARFDAPQELRPTRRPNAHIGFGHGPHVCLGMQLARAEAEIALTEILSHRPQIRLARPDAPARYSQRTGMRGLARLDVVLGPQASPV